MQTITTEIAVIGGGASGLAAAITAAQTGRSVCILERLPRVGKKLLITGNGRCNLGNQTPTAAHYHGNTPQAISILEDYGDCTSFFSGLGLFCTTDEAGRLYPRSNTAASVLDALRLACDKYGVRTEPDCEVTALTPSKNGFRLLTAETEIRARAVIFSAGGYAAPSCGTDGTAMKLLRALGHTVTTPHPALVPIRTDAGMVKALKGIRVQGKVSAWRGGTVLKEEIGEVQFKEDALSGICIFNLSRLLHESDTAMTISINLLPELSAAALAECVSDLCRRRADASLADLLTGLLQKRVGQVLLRSCTAKPLDTPCSALSKSEQALLCRLLQDWQFPARGTAPWQAAQVTAGGIPGCELTASLESKRCPGLYITGEAIDLDGDCGGFNLAWAWASGICAGHAAAQQIGE